MTFRILSFFILLLFAESLLGQRGDFPPNAQPGYCYAKVKESSIKAKPADTTFNVFFRYTGDKKIKYVRRYHDARIDAFGRVQERIPVDEPKKLGKISPSDLVRDTLYTYLSPVEASEGGSIVWAIIVCGGDVGRYLPELALRLNEEGYYAGPENPQVLDAALKKALINYQNDHELQTGHLTLESLIALGIEL